MVKTTSKGIKKNAKGSKKASRKGQSSSKATVERFVEVVKSEDFAKFCGIVVMLFALFLCVSIVSYYMVGEGNNWFGAFGEKLALAFSKGIFGVASLGFAFLFFLYGLKLMKVDSLPLVKTSFISLVWMTWLSCVLGYVNHIVMNKSGNMIIEWAGTFGYYSAEALCNALRGFTPVLLVAIAGMMCVFVHHVKMPNLSGLKRDVDADEEETDPVEEVEIGSLPKKPSLFSRLFSKHNEETDDEEEDSENIVAKTIAPEPIESKPVAKKNESKRPVADIPFSIAGDNVVTPDPMPEEQQAPAVVEEEKEEVKEVVFDIDDAFEKVNARARGTQTAGDPSFTIVDTNSPIANAAEETGTDAEEEVVEEKPRRHFSIDEEYDPHLDYPHYQMPSLDLLEDWETRNVKVTQEELISNKDRIVETLRNYGIEIVDIKAAPGPTVTLYEIKPAPGIRIAKIKGLEDDIALSLSALGIRIIAPLPGKGTIGIEVPNSNPQIVSMKTMLSSDAFQKNSKYELPIALGKTISNEPYVTDLAKMPHLLMAGATGTGKSVGLNAVIASLLYKKHPSELKLIMVDPKKVELSLYSKIDRHFLAKMPDSEEAIITDVKKVVRTLNSLCIEMDNRYDLLKNAQVRKITEYNAKFKARQLNPANGHRFLPYIVLIIDEFADLIMTAGKEVEMPIARLAQLARAVGIHLIVATQRPTTSIITGNIKTNFPGRIAFRVTSVIDSRVILDSGGANQLIGRGDMLISLAGSDMVRLQCALIETEEIERMVNFIGEQETNSEGFILPEYLDENEEPNKDFDPKNKDEFFNEAARLVVAAQFGSTSLLQRKLQLGYNRAGRVIDQLEAAGIVGAHNGSKPREVLIHDEVELENLLKSL